MQQGLTRGYVAAQIAETFANYKLADQPLKAKIRKYAKQQRSNHRFSEIKDERYFWLELFGWASDGQPQEFPPKWTIESTAISEWVARVPGLYWTASARVMRELNTKLIEDQTEEWVTYRPLGKSQKVAGGVGTLRLPANDEGYRLVTLTTTLNASAGIPTLISPDVWAAHRLREGSVIRAKASWREMSQEWAIQFPVVRGIPRGYFVLDATEDVWPYNHEAPIQAHPFSVLEYWDNANQLLDFVYATAITNDRQYRKKITRFFEDYRKDQGRQGEYLLAGDIANPMWDSRFSSPQELRQAKKSQLRLIEARTADAASGKDVTDSLLKALASLSSSRHNDLRRISTDAGIDYRRWSSGGSIAEEITRLVDEAVQSGRQQALLQVVLVEGSRHALEN
jgi:hypothetical protein